MSLRMSHKIGTAYVKTGRLKDIFRKGRGFSRREKKEAIISLYNEHKSTKFISKDFMRDYNIINSVKVDLRRRSKHEDNVEFLKNLPQTVKSVEKKEVKPKKKPVKKTTTAKKTSTAKKSTVKKTSAKKSTKKTSTAKKTSKKTTKKKSSKKTTTKA